MKPFMPGIVMMSLGILCLGLAQLIPPQEPVSDIMISESRVVMTEFMYRAECHMYKYEHTGDENELELAKVAASVVKGAALSQSETDIMKIWSEEFNARVQGRLQITQTESR